MPEFSIFKDSPPTPLSSMNPKVMVIDDDPGVRGALQLRLEKNYQILTCGSGNEGLRTLDDQVYAVILDIKMEDMDGFETLLEIKKQFVELPVIFYSAYQDLKSPYEIMNQYRPFGYVIKEGDITELSDTLKSAVNYSQKVFENQKLILQLKQSLETEKAALEDLRRMDKIKDAFLANTSHELRTPLNGMIGLAEGVLEAPEPFPSEVLKLNMNGIVTSGQRLNHLIDDILDFSQLKHKGLRLNLQSVSLHSLIEVVLRLLQSLVQNRPIVLHNQVSKTLPPVKADEERLQQIFYNLIGNALKFTQSGKVTIDAHQQEDQLEIQVSDSGIGIEEDALLRIFEPFAQEKTTAQPQIGVGLGLAITKQLVELHQGKIHIESAPNYGTTVFFTLPLSDESLAPARGEKTIRVLKEPVTELVLPSHPPTINKTLPFHLCIVDDDPINRQVVSNHLAQQGYSLSFAANGQEALEVIETEPSIDLVILDIMMPFLNGYDTCQKIRMNYSPSDLPVILLTAKNRISDLVQGLQSGANDYLAKPFSREELLARVEAQLKLKQAVEQIKENQRLQEEIAQREQVEQQLAFHQRRLLRLLDIADSVIVVCNAKGVITYMNQSAETFLDYNINELYHQSITRIVPNWKSFSFQGEVSQIQVQRNSLPPQLVQATLSCVKIQEDPSYVISFTPQTATAMGSPTSSPEWLEMAGAGLSQFFAKGDVSFLRETRSVSQSLDHVELPRDPKQIQEDLRSTVVEVINKALDCWQQGTGKSKVDLAEESQVWSVYLERSGSFSTRTLDKYFALSSLPKRPRWRQVITTGLFVLNATKPSNPYHAPLKKSVEHLQQLMLKQAQH